MSFRVATLNLEQDHKRWEMRRHLIDQGIADLKPDILALNEISVPIQSARALQQTTSSQLGVPYNLVQQTRANGLSTVEAEGLLTRFPIIETGNLNFRTRDMVAVVARLMIGDAALDVYVTHLYMSLGDDALRLHQVQELLAWIESRNDGTPSIVCGDFSAT